MTALQKDLVKLIRKHAKRERKYWRSVAYRWPELKVIQASKAWLEQLRNCDKRMKVFKEAK